LPFALLWGALYLPAVVADVEVSLWRENKGNCVAMTFSPNDDGLDRIDIVIPRINEADDRAGQSFIKALCSADQHRRHGIASDGRRKSLP